MQRFCFCTLVAAGMLVACSPAWSQVVVRTPWIEIVVPTKAQVPQPPIVQAPQVLPAPEPLDPGAPPPVPLNPVPFRPVPPVAPTPGIPGTVIPTPSIPSPALAVPTHAEFAAAFKPAPGYYEVVLLHPCTKCPVKVCFKLDQCPRKVRVNKNSLEFRWGLCCCKGVRIVFLPDGRVAVR